MGLDSLKELGLSFGFLRFEMNFNQALIIYEAHLGNTPQYALLHIVEIEDFILHLFIERFPLNGKLVQL